MAKYRKKPVVIEALQWTDTEESLDALLLFASDGDTDALDYDEGAAGPSHPVTHEDWGRLSVTTLEGEHVATPMDWLIKGVQGEFYFCKPDIFAATYEGVSA